MGQQSGISRGPRGNDKTAEREKLFAAIVVFEHDEIVLADDEIETNSRTVYGSELLESVNRPGNTLAINLQTRRFKERIVSDCCGHHFEALLFVEHASLLVRWLTRGHEQNPVNFKLVDGALSDHQVARVNRVESTSHDA